MVLPSMTLSHPKPAILENLNGYISATDHLIHSMFGFRGRWIKWRYFWFDQIQER